MTSANLYAMDDQELDSAAHDYILDKQESGICSMVEMSDNELSDVTAAGFSTFSLNGDVIKASFNIEAHTFTEIESLKMGFYGGGWDEDWTTVSLGNSSTDLVCKGLYIEATFTNIANNPLLGARTLDTLKVGTPSMTGPITATFNSFTGHIESTDLGVVYVDSIRDGRRMNLGTRTITCSNSDFYMQLSRTGDKAGWWFNWNNATLSPWP